MKTSASGRRRSISTKVVDSILERLSGGKRVRRSLPAGGRLHIDRTLPFLVAYRRPLSHEDEGTERLVKGEASYLVASGSKTQRHELAMLVRSAVRTLAAKCGSFLLVEIWSAPPDESRTEDDVPPLRPAFRVVTSATRPPGRTIDTLVKALGRIKLDRRPATVEVSYSSRRAPRGMAPLIPAAEAGELNCFVLGIEVSPVYRDPDSGELFPLVLRKLHLGLSRALKRAFFTFAYSQTRLRPRHYQALGRRAVVKAVWEVDRLLAEVSASFDLLLMMTPVNVEAAWAKFKAQRFETQPAFYYRPSPVDPATLKRDLYAIPIERIEDPVLSSLFTEKRAELERQLTMLEDRGTRRCLYGSLLLNGAVSDELVLLAKEILRDIRPRSREDLRDGLIGAGAFAKRAREEIEYYKKRLPDMSAVVEIRDDIVGLMVSRGNLLVDRNLRIPSSRVEPLIQHEVGTHVLTYYNGLAQPFRLLYSGFSGYEELQEGLAVLAEYLVGGLSRPRLRLLAGRVVAARSVIEGAGFIETFQELNGAYGFEQRTAFTIAARVHRGGGFIKDAVYLRGLAWVMDYVKNGGELDPLFVGKIAAEHVPVIKELQLRGVLRGAPLRPRYLESPATTARSAKLRTIASVPDLVRR